MTTRTRLDRDETDQLLSHIEDLENDDEGYDEVVTVDHYTAEEVNEPLDIELFCHAHRDGVRCTRLRDHAGDHTAYMFSIRTPATWPAAVAEGAME